MRVELATATSGPGIATVPHARARRWRIDGFEAMLLAVFGLLSVWVLGLNLWQVIAHGRVWTGTDGLYLVDQMQYLAWVQSASHHLLIANLFVLRPTPADYFQPAIAISGGLSALGVAPWLALLLWKPVAVISFFFAVRAFVYRSLPGLWPRRVALTLALFFGSFTIVSGDFSVLGDLWPAFLSWGYVFGLLALAAIVVAILRYDAARRQGRIVWLPGALGACATLMHPWQGELLVMLIVGGELVAGRLRPLDRRRLGLAALTIGLTVLPLLYYAVLGRADLSWKLARDASKHEYPLWSLLLAIVPLLIPALLAYRRRATTFLGATTQAWPGAVLILYFVSASALGATPLHAFQGISIPLAVLAVQGVQSVGALRRLPHRALIVAAAIAVVTIPNAAFELKNAADTVVPQPNNATFIPRDERDALTYLANVKQPGGVLEPRPSRGAGPRQDRPPHVRRRLSVVAAALRHAAVHGQVVLYRDDESCRRPRVRPAERRCLRARGLSSAVRHSQAARFDGDRDKALRLRQRVPTRRAEPADGAFGRIPPRCGCSRCEAPIASSATTPTPSSTPPTR